MATRFYYCPDAPGALTWTPSDYWYDDSGEPWRARDSLLQAHGDDASAEVSIYFNNTAPRNMGNYLAGPFNAHTFAVTEEIKAQVCAYCSQVNGYIAYSIRVLKGSDMTERGVLFEGYGPTAVSTAAWANRSIAGGAGGHVHVQNEVAMLAGDYIAIELGGRWDSATYSTVGVHLYNDQSADLPEDETSTSTAHNPWVEFSATIADYSPGPSPIGPSGAIASAEAHGTGKMRGTIQSEV